MVFKVVFLLAFGLTCFGTHASDIFRWTDEKGRVHYSGSVPDQYQRSATKLVPADAQRRAGAAVNDEAGPESIATRRGKSSEPYSDLRALPATASAGNKDRGCEAQKMRYRESQECFAQYRTVTGIKREAFRHCVEVKQPSC